MFLLNLLLATLIVFTGCNMGNDNNETSEDGGDTVTEIEKEDSLIALGFDLDLGEAVNDFGEEVGDTHPLGSDIYSFKLKEIFLSGVDISDAGRGQLLDKLGDSSASISKMFDSSIAWTSCPKKSVMADTDGDGYDEIVTVAYRSDDIYIRIDDKNDNNTVATESIKNSGLAVMNSWYMRYQQSQMRDVCAGDFDGDGEAEIAFSCHNTLTILDSDLSTMGTCSYAVYKDDDSAYEGWGYFNFVRVESANLNGDKYMDLVVTNGTDVQCGVGTYSIYTGSESGLDLNGNGPVTSKDLTSGGHSLCAAEIVTADFDRDGLDEVLFAGVDNASDAGFTPSVDAYAFIMKFYKSDRTYNETELLNAYKFISDHNWKDGGHYHGNFQIPMTAAGDFNSDNAVDVLIMDTIYTYDGNGNFDEADFQIYDDITDGDFNRMNNDLAVAGDFTGDGIDDLAFIRDSYVCWLKRDTEYMTVDEYDTFCVWGRDEEQETNRFYQEISLNSDEYCPCIACGNVDDDSLILQYYGRKLVFSEPKILAVLASPPYTPSMNIEDSGTTYAMTCGNSEEDSYSFGWYIEGSAGVGGDLEYIESINSITTHHDFAFGFCVEHSYESEVTYTNMAGKDMVICAVVPLDVYLYTYLNYPDNFTPMSEYYTVSVPRDYQTMFVSLSKYNKSVSEENRIPDDLLKHTPGDISSYYTKEEMETLSDASEGIFTTWEQTVGESASEAGMGISTSDSRTETYDYNMTLGVKNETSLSSWIKVVVEYGYGFQYSYNNSYNTSEGTTISGNVGYFPNEEDYDRECFRWGIMCIPVSFNGDDGDVRQKFNLVTYWVK